MSRTRIMPCTCVHHEQDRMHDGMRVFNEIKRQLGHPIEYRCTVCRKVQEGAYAQGEEKDDDQA